ncbi:MAG: TrkH family potassium uptake protein [Clostridium sp.]|nr:TrkH family potassium uptake protein [Clostridium sp.]
MDKLNTNKKKRIKNKNYYSSYPKLVALSFIALILIGTFLLMLPISVKNGDVSFLDALFTATSASCVTGLVVFDTFSKWTLFGQLVILCMIQIGGLGFITIMTMLASFVKKRVSLREKLLLKESVGTIYKGEMKALVKVVLYGTIIFEVLGAILLSSQFIPQMGFKNGLYTSVFLSVSAFCNAGFDVMGRVAPGSSLISVNDNPVVLLTISLLIILGGLGFIVWDDIYRRKTKFKRYSVHTKITLVTTLILLAAGTISFFIFEWNNTLADMPLWQKGLNAFFCSVTPRTAGFNSVPNSDLTGISKMVTYALMFVGGSSGSTAGGIKTVTLAVLILCAVSSIRNKRDIELFGRRITFDAVRKAASIASINISAIFVSSAIITFCQPELGYSNILFECISAIGTVGMTTGITASLHTVPKIIIALMMYIGRITSLIFAFSIIFSNRKTTTRKPSGNLLIG